MLIFSETFRKGNRLFGTLRRNLGSKCILTTKKVEEIKIPVPWGHIAGKWWGDKNEVPVLALHGWVDNANTFDKLIPKLNLSSIFAIDLPGHGLSSHLPEGKTYDFQDFLISLHQIFKNLNWTDVPLLTHSFGGVIGLVYASLFPDRVKWIINMDCARSLLIMHRFSPSRSYSSAIDTFLKVEKQKNMPLQAYKLSDIIPMTIEGSVASVASAESALTLLKRGTKVVENLAEIRKVKRTTGNAMQHVMEFEKKMALLLPEEERNELEEAQARILKEATVVIEKFKNCDVENGDDEYYVLTRDPALKSQAFQSFSPEFIFEACKQICCPVLSIRAKNGFLHGSSKRFYEETLRILKAHSPYFEHHEVDGTHHTHLNTPQNVVPIINNFIDKIQM